MFRQILSRRLRVFLAFRGTSSTAGRKREWVGGEEKTVLKARNSCIVNRAERPHSHSLLRRSGGGAGKHLRSRGPDGRKEGTSGAAASRAFISSAFGVERCGSGVERRWSQLFEWLLSLLSLLRLSSTPRRKKRNRHYPCCRFSLRRYFNSSLLASFLLPV